MPVLEIDFNELFKEWYGSQKDFVYDFKADDSYNNFYLIFLGGNGAGKTLALARKAILSAYLFPASKSLVTRLYYEDLEATTMATLLSAIPPEMVIDWHSKKGILVVQSRDPDRHSIIEFKGMFRRRKAESLGSLEYNFAFVDEASEMPERTLSDLRRRLRFPTTKIHFMALTAVGPGMDHHLYSFFELHKDPNRRVYHSSSRENLSLTQGYLNELEQMPEYQKQAFIEGGWGLQYLGKPVFPEFTRSFHVKHLEVEPSLPMYRSWDFGFHHPAVLLAQIDNDGRVFIFSALMGEDIYLDNFYKLHLEQLNKYYDPSRQDIYDTCDIAGSQRQSSAVKTDIETLKELVPDIRLRTRFCKIDPRIKLIRQLLSTKTHDGKPMLVVNDQDCEILINAFMGGYHYPEVFNPKLETNEPLKDGFYDHIIDALGYLLINYYRSYKSGQQEQRNRKWLY